MTLNAPLLAQNGSYSAAELRNIFTLFPNVGVVEKDDLKVSQRGAGANMSVDVAAGRCVIASSTASRGKYLCQSTATENLAIAAAPGAGNSRIDLVVATVYDTQYSDPDDEWTLSVVTGTPSATPSAPALPSNSILLASVAVGAEVASITNANITDGRYYAKAVTHSDSNTWIGAYGQVLVDSTGLLRAWNGSGWTATPTIAAFRAGTTSIGSTALTASSTAYGTTTVTQPSGAVNVIADATGTFVCGSSTNGVCEFIVEISIDGGSTWTAGPTITDLSENTLTPRSIQAVHLRSNVTPSGSVRARVMARRTTSTAVTLNPASVRVMVTPAG